MGIISHKKKGRAWRFRETSLQRYESLIPELEEKTGIDVPVNKQGIFKLLFAEDNLEKWHKLKEFRQGKGWNLEIGDRDYLRQRCPQIVNESIIGAVHSPQDRQIHPVKLSEALVAGAKMNGVKFQFGVTVSDFVTRQKNELMTCQELVTNMGNIEAERVIISAGLGSTLLTQTLQQTIPIRPVLGQAIEFQLDEPFGRKDFQPVITANDLHIVPLDSGRYWLGATVEFPTETGESIADEELLKQLMPTAISFCPLLKKAEILRTWSGKRPRPEGIAAPVIQPLANYKNVLLATAHYRNGVLLAPATALEVVKMIADL